MSKKVLSASNKNAKLVPVPGFVFERRLDQIEEYVLKTNGLHVLYLQRKDTGVVTTNITYFVGSKDESRGETGVAHMLEHMLFKPTAHDVAHHIAEGSAMHFERKTGSTLNANTWKDRTTYYFSYPREYFTEALRIEADRMQNVILTDNVLTPEQGNVLSEFDMYNGDPQFALAVQMYSTAFHSHPYGHETIGYREDIEDFTAEKLQRYYKNYYRPDNAVLMVVGDIDRTSALTAIREHFSTITNPSSLIPRHLVREPKQEGIRRVSIKRPSTTDLVSIGFKHPGFPKKEWFTNSIMLDVLVGGPESILHKLLVDTGVAAHVASSLEPTAETNLAMIDITLAPGDTHEKIEATALKAIKSLTVPAIEQLVKKAKAKMITQEFFGRTESLQIVAELTEYASAGDLSAYTSTQAILASIATKDVQKALTTAFMDTNLTIGYFIGTQQ